MMFGQHLIEEWEQQWPPFDSDESLHVSDDQANNVLIELGQRLQDNYPYFHPSYAGQMLKPPHPVAMAAYAMAQRINPNNHALDGGKATSALEIEVIAGLKTMFGYPVEKSLGHLTSSGTIANLEALWIARELAPEKAIAYSTEAHYTHSRMCGVLRTEAVAIDSDNFGRIDLDALETELKTGRIGTVVATAGTTSLGAVDPIHEIIPLVAKYGVRLHVDAAYGGFFRLLVDPPSPLHPSVAAAFRAIESADSIVIDPHKHGLQPYGCGAVLFRDAAIGSIYKHDSPYTYFTSADLHLGEISLECSRAGAAAAALWATLEVLPLQSSTGLGQILRTTRAAATRWSELIQTSQRLQLVVEPDLDIVSFYPLPTSGDLRTSTISTLTENLFVNLMNDPNDPLYLATLKVPPSILESHNLQWDTDHLLAFRSVLMKPEHNTAVPALHRRIEQVLNKTP